MFQAVAARSPSCNFSSWGLKVEKYPKPLDRQVVARHVAMGAQKGLAFCKLGSLLLAIAIVTLTNWYCYAKEL